MRFSFLRDTFCHFVKIRSIRITVRRRIAEVRRGRRDMRETDMHAEKTRENGTNRTL